MVAEFIDYLLSIIVDITFISFIFIIWFFSDLKRYKFISISLIIPVIILEIPHFLMMDIMLQPDLGIIDIAVHIAAGLAIFTIIINLPFFSIKKRVIFGMIIVISTILVIETFLSILELTIGYVNPIGMNEVYDIVNTIIGGVIGMFIYYIYLYRNLKITLYISNKRLKIK